MEVICVSRTPRKGSNELGISFDRDPDVKTYKEIQRSLKRYLRIKASSFNGTTQLHVACKDGNRRRVKQLLAKSSIDPNVENNKGIKPIHLAILYDHLKIVETLLVFGAHVDTLFKLPLYHKIKDDLPWAKDFGDKITLLTHAIICNNVDLAKLLIDHGADLKIRSRSNRTLLMCAVNGHCLEIIKHMLPKLTRHEVNYRDNEGMSAIHFLLTKEQFGKWRYNHVQTCLDSTKGSILKLLIKQGADINATIKGDPSTLLINMAAYRALPTLIRILQPRQTFSTIARPLSYALIPDHLSTEIINYLERKNNSSIQCTRHHHLDYPPDTHINCKTHFKLYSYLCIRMILNDLRCRLAFGYPIHEDESKGLKTLIEKSDKHRFYVAHVDKSIPRLLQWLDNTVISYGDKNISLYKLVKSNRRELEILINDQIFFHAFESFDCDWRLEDFYFMVQQRVLDIKERRELLNDFRTLFLELRNKINIPFDCLWEIVKYLNNEELTNFLNCFIYTPLNDKLIDVNITVNRVNNEILEYFNVHNSLLVIL
ncbi:uncharacterized protein LOC128668370 [Microplitis demolitor]|uniref:uncharacterized protein LOC128668370 n=1 Tax=Microplitis demolitor TaxID=69319 RepID=UPI00235B6265|nr:uncharacterized protein LOC128668370 [Microplitis demolitor]